MLEPQAASNLISILNARKVGESWMACCPAHDDRTPSLSLRETNGRLLVHCHAGCPQDRVLAALTKLGSSPSIGATRHQSEAALTGHAGCGTNTSAITLRIWDEAGPGAGLTRYLANRSIRGLALPQTLRLHPCLRHAPSNRTMPAMIASVQDGLGRLCAVHRTYLTQDATTKADVAPNKMALGSFRDGAVRLGPAGPVLGIAEGIETALAAQVIADVPVWAACGSRMDRVHVPPIVKEVMIFADNGKAGHEAALHAAKHFTSTGRSVRIYYPPPVHGDWNDALVEAELS